MLGSLRAMNFTLRLFLACGLFSLWMILLFTGFALGGWAHLSLAAALVLFPWRARKH